jgi:hypothetical protein
MRWEDEQYVRFYKRDTPEWVAMSWQARGLFGLIMRVVDRAGILKLGHKLKLRGLAPVLHAPWSEIEGPLQELLDDGCCRYNQDQATLYIPNFIEAQETGPSETSRKRKYREDARLALQRSQSGLHDVNGTSVPSSDASTGASSALSGSPQHSSESSESTARSASTGGAVVPPTETVARRKGTRLPEDWEPNPQTMAVYTAQGIDCLASLKRFRNHWLSTTKNATKLDWDRTFENWVDTDIERGVAKKLGATNGANATGVTRQVVNGRVVDMQGNPVDE